MIQQITISIDVPDGYEFVGYREPMPCEPWLSPSGYVRSTTMYEHDSLKVKRIILRKKWAFPAWFAAGWFLEKNEYGDWHVTKDRSWTWNGIKAEMLWAFHGETFNPPTVDKLQCVR